MISADVRLNVERVMINERISFPAANKSGCTSPNVEPPPTVRRLFSTSIDTEFKLPRFIFNPSLNLPNPRLVPWPFTVARK